MPKEHIPNANALAKIIVPEPGDARTASSVFLPIMAVANQVAACKVAFGQNWSIAPIASSLPAGKLTGVVGGKALGRATSGPYAFAIWEPSGGGDVKVYSTVDGLQWRDSTSQFASSQGSTWLTRGYRRAVHGGGLYGATEGRFVFFGNSGWAYLADGVGDSGSWSAVGFHEFANTTKLNDACHGPGTDYFFVGTLSAQFSTKPAFIRWRQATTYEHLSTAIGDNGPLYALAYSPELECVVAVGGVAGLNTNYVTYWTQGLIAEGPGAAGVSATPKGVAWSGAKFVAITYAGDVVGSADGDNWELLVGNASSPFALDSPNASTTVVQMESLPSCGAVLAAVADGNQRSAAYISIDHGKTWKQAAAFNGAGVNEIAEVAWISTWGTRFMLGLLDGRVAISQYLPEGA